MKKLDNVMELNNEFILTIGRKNDFELCTGVNQEGETLLLDEDSLSTLLKELGLTYLTNTNDKMYYSIEDTFIEVPFDIVHNEDFDDDDIFLNFDLLNVISKDTKINGDTLLNIRGKCFTEIILYIFNGLLTNNNVSLAESQNKVLQTEVFNYMNTLFTKENNNPSLKHTTSLAVEIIDILEDILCDGNIYIESTDRTGSEDEACIYGEVYYELEDKIVHYLDSIIVSKY